MRKYLYLLLFIFVHSSTYATADSCQKVSGLYVSNVTSHSATLSWEETPGSIGYQYVVSKTQTPPDKFGLFVKKPFYAADQLAANSTYYAHVRTSCPGASISGWVTVQFNTPDPNENYLGLEPGFAVLTYPLETDRSVTVKAKGSDEKEARVTLMDVLGRKIREYTLTGDRLHIEVSGLPANIYLVRYNDVKGRIQTMRFTKR